MQAQTTRRALLGTTGLAIIAVPIAAAGSAPSTDSATPFRVAEGRYYAARTHYEALPDDIEVVDPPAFERERQAFFDALRAVDQAPVSTWQEFADAFEIACDGGESLPPENLVTKLLADVRRLSGRASA